MSEPLPPPSWPPGPHRRPDESDPGTPPPPAPRLDPGHRDDVDLTIAHAGTGATPDDPWAVPSPRGEDATPGTWEASPAPSRRRRWLVGLLAVVVAVVGIGVASSLVDDDTSGSATAATDLGPAQAEAYRTLFATIDQAELAMIGLLEATPADVGSLSDDELRAFREEAASGAGTLRDRLDDLLAQDDAGDPDVDAMRDVYGDHLQAWLDWAEALSGDPTVLDRPDARDPYYVEIDVTADDFTESVDRHLDRSRVPTDVVDRADRILQRGFTSSGDDGTEV